MSGLYRSSAHLPPEQQAIRANCFHPTGTFVEFTEEEIEQLIPERFEKIVWRYPDRLAVKTNNHALTYDELNKAANRVACAILAQPGKDEEPVALLFEHGVFIIAAILGILKAGRIYVPLDPALPPTRTAYMLEDSQAKLLLTNTTHLPLARRLAQDGQHILNCDDGDPTVAAANLDRPISSETRALILYTSGSTGHPKGVLHNHRNILVETRNYTNDVRICPEDRLSLCQSCSFANSIRNIYGALLNGATLFPYDLNSEGFSSLAEWLRANQITIFHTLATIIRRIRDTIAADTTFPALRILRFGGEPSNGEEVKYFQRRFAPNCVLMNVIGLTETFTIRRYFVIQEWRPGDAKVPLGYGVPGKEVFLLDEAGQEVGANQIGEIAVRSKHLALGYWQRPDLTQAAFIPDPHGGNERVYLTGDLGMMRPDGCLIHMGRKDFQVKIRGSRVEVAEIEAALLKLDSIQAAVVLGQADDAGEQRLVAYVVPAEAKAPTVSELRRALAPTLPDYMIPSAFVFLETLPVVPNGRIDRRALPAPNRARPALEVPYVEPRTPIELDLAGIWAEVLNVERIGIHDNFFDLGGHSLLAVRLFAQIEKEFNRRLPLSSLFQGATIEHLASLISQKNRFTPWPAVVALQPQGSKRPFFCVHELSGDVLCYMNLARYLGQDQPIYALRARGLDGIEEPFTDIEAMATYYIEKIRTVQPQGPYALGGLSFGGIVAFEMARQLRAAGEAVDVVALLDSPAAHSGYRGVAWSWSFLGNFLIDLPSWLIGSLQLNRSQWLDLIRLKIRRAQATLAVNFRSPPGLSETQSANFIKEMGDLFQFSEQHRKIARAQYVAFREYRPQVYPGRVTLFRARMQPLFSSHTPDKGWERLAAGGLEIRVVPGNHLGMLQEPHVQVLAKQLRTCLDDAQTGIVVNQDLSRNSPRAASGVPCNSV